MNRNPSFLFRCPLYRKEFNEIINVIRSGNSVENKYVQLKVMLTRKVISLGFDKNGSH